MGVADDIKKLGEDIVASYDLRVNSYDLRVKEIRKLAKDTQNMLKGFQREQKNMATELRKTLKEGEVVRLKEVLDLLQEFKTEREKMSANWQALTAAMAKRRSIKPKVEAEVKVRSVKEVIKEETKENIVAPETGLEEKVYI